jgi:hypothetical protein
MSEKIFSYAPVNPIRAAKVITFDPRFESAPFDYQEPDECYYQPWKTVDQTTLQVLSDFEPTLNWYDSLTDIFVRNTPFTAVPSSIVDQTYLCYEAVIVFDDFEPGRYYFKITYTDDTFTDQTWVSDTQNIQLDQDNTILFEYTNSTNDFNVIFETGSIFNLRVEGSISLFKPEFNNVIYNDINENSTKLYGDPYRGFKLFIAYTHGVADWMIDKVNRIMACDQIKIEGVYYDMADGAKWEQTRADLYSLSGANIDIQEVENRFLDKLQLGPTPGDNTIIIVSKSLVFNNQAVNLAIPGVFKNKTLLDCITFYLLNPVFVPFTLKVSTTNDDTGLFYIEEFKEEDVSALGTITATIREAFDEPVTLYLLGWADGFLANVCILYHQYDAPAISGSVNPYKSLGLGAIVEYDPPAGDLISVDFNLGTGLGNVDTDWFGWAICDGRNGTPDKGGFTTRGYKATYPDPITGLPVDDYNIPGNNGGSDSHVITYAEMPIHNHGFDKRIVLGRSDNARDADVYTSGWEGSSNNLNTLDAGGDEAMDWRNKYLVGLYVKKINN